jgi:hypothetical protein
MVGACRAQGCGVDEWRSPCRSRPLRGAAGSALRPRESRALASGRDGPTRAPRKSDDMSIMTSLQPSRRAVDGAWTAVSQASGSKCNERDSRDRSAVTVSTRLRISHARYRGADALTGSCHGLAHAASDWHTWVTSCPGSAPAPAGRAAARSAAGPVRPLAFGVPRDRFPRSRSKRLLASRGRAIRSRPRCGSGRSAQDRSLYSVAVPFHRWCTCDPT